MTRAKRYHRWDNDAPDTRVRQPHEATVPGWTHSLNSTFAEPSRLGRIGRAGRRSRRAALWLAAGVGAAVVGGAAPARLRRRRSVDD